MELTKSKENLAAKRVSYKDKCKKKILPIGLIFNFLSHMFSLLSTWTIEMNVL